MILTAIWSAVTDIKAGRAIQDALDEQRRHDMFEILCPECSGYGVVADYANWDISIEDGEPVKIYMGKPCGACGGQCVL